MRTSESQRSPSADYEPPSPTSSLRRLPLIEALSGFFASRGVETYLFGGAVRDLLLGRYIGDVDVAVAADASQIGRELASQLGATLVPLSESRDIVRVVLQTGESTSWLDLGPLEGSVTEDMGRRDFTVDAMAVSLADAAAGLTQTQVIDPTGGLSDLRAGVIRAVSSSVFEADPARLMRAPRLAAELRFEIAEDTALQIRRDARLVTEVAPERVRDELLKLLAAPDVAGSLRLLLSLGLLLRVMPELAEAQGVTQPREHYWDVFDHLLETAGKIEVVTRSPVGSDGFVDANVPTFASMNEHFAEEVSDGHTRLTLLKLAGLLHDVAKSATKTVESSGRIRFLGHHTEGARTAGRILKRLRLSRRGIELVRLMIKHHLRPSQMAHDGDLPTGKAIYRYYRDVGDAAVDTLYLNMADYLAARGPRLQPEDWSEHCRVIGHVLGGGLEQKVPESLPKLIDGHDIMEALSLTPGPQVGLLLDAAHEAQAGGEIGSREEALKLVKSMLSRHGGGGA